MEKIILLIIANILYLIKTKGRFRFNFFEYLSNILLSLIVYDLYLYTNLELLTYLASVIYCYTIFNLFFPNWSFLIFLLLSEIKIHTKLLAYGILLKLTFNPQKAEEAIIFLNMTDRYSKALALNNKLLKTKRTVGILSHKLYSLLQIGNYKEANAVVDEILKTNHNNIRFLAIKGDILLNLKEYEKALVFYEKVLFYRPNSLEVIYNMGKAYFELENWEESEAKLNQALSLNPFFIPAYTALVRVYLKQNLKEQAIKVLNKIKEIVPEMNKELQKEINILYKKAENL
ncbi:tetratricopeptide repeat protein [Anaerobranca gottschalkii]|uniref:Tetratricopeptide repeat-containing protein n=1 Tax=Anaerobranca gottschalkii DSM 13577 TaxID=1120990 RepID=A0A1I0B183_9FIRM|nr:tetratricopeptide repeat protein [Anaerobranca gottschalkii]SES99829.1 Tetratricopeptide repeat-containing protein [Anaerobranca gottschalkii DSM 13577]